ncbi:sporulation protein [Enterovibrio sp. ZSDZ35]|uniref:Sporulation protein n=1 Tax=Enterovibrio qingdaonensis TaxID=2899818 RepID=A0ABT5QSN6_9GAMM|nr:sporulation protein [Enterovibrio sp. ZSDZ35]MDD1784001.1 sporulation protein [Enterovibrio sp. ZSDZ35]
MGWFKKALARVGVGNASVSVSLDDEHVMQGAERRVSIKVEGGGVPQSVTAIECSLRCHYMGWEEIRTGGEQGKKRQWKKLSHTLCTWSLPDAFTLLENETRELTTEFIVPDETPVTFGTENVWLAVRLDIPMAKDAVTELPVAILPSRPVDAMLKTFERLGFRIEKETTEQPKRGRRPFEQAFMLVPIQGPYSDNWSRVSLTVTPEQDMLELAMQFSAKGEGLSHLAGHLTGANKLDRTLQFDKSTSSENIALAIEELLGKIM